MYPCRLNYQKFDANIKHNLYHIIKTTQIPDALKAGRVEVKGVKTNFMYERSLSEASAIIPNLFVI